MSIKVVAVMTCINKDSTHIEECVNSLFESISPPEEIIITLLERTELPKSLARKYFGRLHIQYLDKDYQSLTALVGFMERYPEHNDVYTIYLNSDCVYPLHLISEYKHSLAELNKTIKDKLPDSKGSVFGISGIVMVEDKKRNMEKEFLSLTDTANASASDNDSASASTNFEKRTLLGSVQENATVDYLESVGSILIHRSQLQDDFLIYLGKVWTNDITLSPDVILCNYFALKNIMRTQVCNIIINRYMMARMACFKNHKELPDQEKRDTYENTIKHLRGLQCFSVYK
jgi:hypothetical protein